MGLCPPGPAPGDEAAQPVTPRANQTFEKSTKEEEAPSCEKSSKVFPQVKRLAKPYETAWYDRAVTVVLLLVGFFPMGIYALYRNSTFSAGIKISLVVGWALLVIIYLMLVFGNIQPEGRLHFLPIV